MMEWRPRENKDNRGRPPTRWTNDAKIIAGRWVNAAQERTKWNTFQSGLRPGPVTATECLALKSCKINFC